MSSREMEGMVVWEGIGAPVERGRVVIGVAGGAVSGTPVVVVEIIVGNHERVCSTGLDLFWIEQWPPTI